MKPFSLALLTLLCFRSVTVVAQEFEKEVLPILQTHCFKCHGPEEQKSGLRLDSRAALLSGGDFGAAIVPGVAENSLLIEVISSSDDDVKMPPKGDRLTSEQIETLKKWIADGAVWPDQMDAVAEEKVSSDHWSFQPLAKTFTHESIDGFLGTINVPVADRRSLIRRITLDVTGLPPTPQEVESFVQDTDNRALQKGRSAFACIKALRRALGPALARCHPLR